MAAAFGSLPPAPPYQNGRKREPVGRGFSRKALALQARPPRQASKNELVSAAARAARTPGVYGGGTGRDSGRPPGISISATHARSVLGGFRQASRRAPGCRPGGGGGTKPAAALARQSLWFSTGSRQEGNQAPPQHAAQATRRPLLAASCSAFLASSRACSRAATYDVKPLRRGCTRIAAPGTR